MQLTSHQFKARSRDKLADANLQGALKKLQGNFVKGRADRVVENSTLNTTESKSR